MPTTLAAPPLALAINPTRVGKMTKQCSLAEWRAFNDGFQNVEFNTGQLLEEVHRGHSFCSRHAHIHRKLDPYPDGSERISSHRHTLNWLPTSVATLDIDKTRRGLQAMWALPLVGEWACFGYTTTSSTPEDPHIRIVWSLPKPVQRIENFRLLLAALAKEFEEADLGSKDPVKAYAGNHTPSFSYIEHSEVRLPPTEVERLVRRYQEALAAEEDARKAHNAELMRQYGTLPERTWGVEDVREMLRFIPPQPGYHDWVNCLMAVHSVFPDEMGVSLCEEWSPGTPGEVRTKFRSFRQGSPDSQGVISIKWLIVVAKRYGYVVPRHHDDRVSNYISSVIMRR